MLQSALAKHPDIMCGWELLHETLTDHNYKSIFQTPNKKAIGFKLQEYQGHDTDLRQYIQENKFKAIVLTRNDSLELMVSLQAAKEYGYWHTHGSPFPATKVNITPEQYKEFLNWQAKVLVDTYNDLKGLDTLPMTYEELTQDWQGAIDRICLFLGVDPMPLKPDINKGRVAALNNWIDNEDELRSVK